MQTAGYKAVVLFTSLNIYQCLFRIIILQQQLVFTTMSKTVYSIDALEKARNLNAPMPLAKKNGELEDIKFWQDNEEILEQAWEQYGNLHPLLYSLNKHTFFSTYIWEEWVKRIPSLQGRGADVEGLKQLRYEVIDGVWVLNGLFTKTFCHQMLEELDYLSRSNIPQRRPNGMNRYGAILDDIGFKKMFDMLAEKVIIPLALDIFPKTARKGDLSHHHAFVVHYKEGEDLDLDIHADASCITLNLCLGRTFTGGDLAFEEYVPGFSYSNTSVIDRKRIRFKQGMAILHRGQHRHEALMLEHGERVNLVLWLFGEDGYVRITDYDEALSRDEIWNMEKYKPTEL